VKSGRDITVTASGLSRTAAGAGKNGCAEALAWADVILTTR
jgi:hypothetical protein